MRLEIDALLKAALALGSSDLHLKVGARPMVRINGVLTPLGDITRLSREDAYELAYAVMNPAQKGEFSAHCEVDMAYSVSGLGRFRVNVFQQRGTVGMAFRSVPFEVLPLERLQLPPVIKKLAMEPRGLILVTGTTGSGKSTTLASIIDAINRNQTVNIITIEDPIEFLHKDKKGIVSQREVGQDTESFPIALRSALRQDPDVIMLGEMRDFDTVSTALVAAETGHLVLSTLHTLDASETINRIVMVFPPHQQKQIRLQLASVIRGIISMRLIPSADGKRRLPAVEVMVSTQTIREAIIDPDKTRNIPDIIEAGTSQYGMQTFDHALYERLKKEEITYEEAMNWASNPENFALKVSGIQSTSESWEEERAKEEPNHKIGRF